MRRQQPALAITQLTLPTLRTNTARVKSFYLKTPASNQMCQDDIKCRCKVLLTIDRALTLLLTLDTFPMMSSSIWQDAVKGFIAKLWLSHWSSICNQTCCTAWTLGNKGNKCAFPKPKQSLARAVYVCTKYIPRQQTNLHSERSRNNGAL